MSDYGIKISQLGYDIKTTGLENQILNSTANSLKIWMTGSININVPDFIGFTIDAHTDISHNLGYPPYYVVFFKLKDANKLWLQDSLDTTMLPGNYITGRAYSNSSILRTYITVNGNNLSAWTGKAYYYIFIDKAYE